MLANLDLSMRAINLSANYRETFFATLIMKTNISAATRLRSSYTGASLHKPPKLTS